MIRCKVRSCCASDGVSEIDSDERVVSVTVLLYEVLVPTEDHCSIVSPLMVVVTDARLSPLPEADTETEFVTTVSADAHIGTSKYAMQAKMIPNQS